MALPLGVRRVAAIVVLCGLTGAAPSASPGASDGASDGPGDRIRWHVGPFRLPAVPATRVDDGDRLAGLLREGTLALSLEDAIALAIENNFDVALQRLTRDAAETDWLRAEGGGDLRGLPTLIRQLPAGQGGPGEPLLATAGGYSPVTQLPSSSANLATTTGVQTDASVLGATPYSSGPAVPLFDATLGGTLGLATQNEPQASSFLTGTNILSTHLLQGGVSLSKGFSTGAALTGAFSSSRTSESSTRLGLDPYTSGAFSLSLVQPLWRGAGTTVNRRFIRIANLQRDIADDVFRAQVIQTVFDVIRLYWDYVSLTQDVDVKRQALTAAERLHDDTRAQIDEGTQAPIQLTQAQALVATNRQMLNEAEGLAQQQELLLKEVLTRRGIADPALAAARIVPLTPSPAPETDALPPLASLLHDALGHRPDLALARRQLEASNTSLIGSRNALRPEVNLVASIQGNGLAGRPNPDLAAGSTPTDPAFVGAYRDALRQILKADYRDLAAGVQVTVPLQNRIAKADAARDLVQVRQTAIRIAQVESQVRLEVGNAWIAVQRARVSVDAAVETKRLQEEAVAVERERFDAGVSTTYNVIQMEANLALARSAEVSARGVYAKARAALDRATAATLDVHHVIVDAARGERLSR